MKKQRLLMLMFASAALLFASCKKNTTYTFIDNFDMSDPQQYIRDYSVILSEYDASGSIVFKDIIDWPTVGERYVYTANKHSEKVKVKIQYECGPINHCSWIQQVWYLEKGKNIDVIIDGETVEGNQEP